MAVQILNDPGRAAGFGQALGSGISSGLGQLLQSVAENKVRELNRKYEKELFEQQFPEQADLLSLFSGHPQIQANLIGQFNKQKVLQQQQQSELAALNPELLLQQGIPQKLVGQIAQVSDPKYKKLLLENYLKQQNKPTGIGEATTAFLRNLGIPVPGESRLPGIGEEQTKQQQQAERAAQYYGQQQAQAQNPVFQTTTQLPRLEVNPAPSTNPFSALKSLYNKPGLAATGSLEGLLGLPGAVASIPESLASLIGGSQEVLAPYKQQMNKKLAEAIGIPEDQLAKLTPQGKRGQKIPTPSDIRQLVTKPFAEAVGSEKFLPTNEAEDAVTAIFQEAAPEVVSALTTGGVLPIAKGISKGLARAFGANTAGWATQTVTGSEKAGNLVKFGTYLASSMYPTRLKDAAKNRYGVWEEAIQGAKNKEIPVSYIDARLQKIQKEVNGMDKFSPAAKFMKERLGALEDKLHLNPKGKQFINIDTLADLRKSQNALYNDAVKAGATKPYNELLSAEKSLMEEWAKSAGKTKAFKAFEQGNEIYSALSESEKMNSFMQDLAKARSISFGAGMLMGGLPAAAKGLIVSGFGVKNVYNLMKRLLSVPAIRNEYGRLLKASALNNAKSGIVAAHRLDNLVKKVGPKLNIQE